MIIFDGGIHGFAAHLRNLFHFLLALLDHLCSYASLIFCSNIGCMNECTARNTTLFMITLFWEDNLLSNKTFRFSCQKRKISPFSSFVKSKLNCQKSNYFQWMAIKWQRFLNESGFANILTERKINFTQPFLDSHFNKRCQIYQRIRICEYVSGKKKLISRNLSHIAFEQEMKANVS